MDWFIVVANLFTVAVIIFQGYIIHKQEKKLRKYTRLLAVPLEELTNALARIESFRIDEIRRDELNRDFTKNRFDGH